jgi:large subunit ribosomal protein L32
MGAVPNSRIGPRRKRLRRTHYKAALVALVPCETCGQLHRPHHVCPFCGSYRGVEVIRIEDEAP